MHWRRKCQPTPVFLPGESQGQGSLMGCHLWGRTESDMTEATYQQQQQPVFLPGEYLGQWSLAGYSPWGHKELDRTEHTQVTLICLPYKNFFLFFGFSLLVFPFPFSFPFFFKIYSVK